MDPQSCLNISLFHLQTILPARRVRKNKTKKTKNKTKKKAAKKSFQLLSLFRFAAFVRAQVAHLQAVWTPLGACHCRRAEGDCSGACDSRDGWLSFPLGVSQVSMWMYMSLCFGAPLDNFWPAMMAMREVYMGMCACVHTKDCSKDNLGKNLPFVTILKASLRGEALKRRRPPFPTPSPVTAVPRKPRQPQTAEPSFASKDTSAHPLPVSPPFAIPSPSSACGLEQRQLPSPLSPAGEGGLLPHQGRLPKAAAVRSRQGGKENGEEGGGLGRETVEAALSSEQSERPLGGAPAPGAASRALGLPPGPSSSVVSSAAPHRGPFPSCGQGPVGCVGSEPGPRACVRWEIPMARGFRASRKMT